MPVNFVSLGKFLQSQVVRYDPQFYAAPQLNLWGVGSTYIPTFPDLPLGLDRIESFRKEYVGRAALSTGQTLDVPLVDLGISSNDIKTIAIMAGAEWNLFQVEKYANLGSGPRMNLVDEKLDAINYAINHRFHELTWAGEPVSGLDFRGIFNARYVNVLNETGTNVMALTQAQLYDWFQSVIATYKAQSGLAYNQITAYVSDALYIKTTTPYDVSGSGESPFSRLTDPNRGRFLNLMEPITELASASLFQAGLTTNANRGILMLGYFDRRSIRRSVYPIDRTDVIPRDTGLEFGVTGFCAVSEPEVKMPEHFLYVQYATA
ncbi:DUF2184 domain-containing protein [bacterium]|nr:DUF2184 domain-containing protein [bacterium]